MRTKIWYAVVFLFILIYSCQNNGRLKEGDVNEAKKLVLEKGDKYAYDDLLIYYDEQKEFEYILPYSLIMAYKYNYSYAYFEIYVTIIKIHNKGLYDKTLIKNLDLKSREFAISNLIKSAKLGNISAKGVLIKYYFDGIYLPKNIELSKKYENEIKIR